MSYKELWLDLETTGVDHNINGIIQIAAVAFIDGVERDSFVSYVKPFPDDIIEDKALEVNRVTREMLETFPDPGECFAALSQFLQQFIDQFDSGDKLLICGYNVGFDTDFLRKFWAKNNSQYYGSYFFQQPLDVLQLAVLYSHVNNNPQPYKMRLSDAIEGLGLEMVGDLHDAKADIDMTRKVYLELAKRMNLI